MMMNYEETDEFVRDFKKLQKIYESLAEDLETAKKNAIELFHLREVDNQGIFEIQGVGNTGELKFFKLKKFACKSLPGRGVRSGIRITYAYFPSETKIVFLEVYFKAKQENEDRTRISKFIHRYNRESRLHTPEA